MKTELFQKEVVRSFKDIKLIVKPLQQRKFQISSKKYLKKKHSIFTISKDYKEEETPPIHLMKTSFSQWTTKQSREIADQNSTLSPTQKLLTKLAT